MSTAVNAIKENENALLPFMARVGVGQTGSKQLSREEARQAMEAVLGGNFNPVTFGAFFMGLRYKGETPTELAGFLDAMYAAQQPVGVDAPEELVSCAGAYDGKARTCNIGIAAALVTAAAGVPMALHGTRGVPTKFGMTTSHVLEALGVNVARSLQAVTEVLHSVGIGYIDQSVFNPAMYDLLPYRSQMGKRTILNTMETLSNPFGARVHIGGFFHDAYADLICQALQQDDMPYQRAILVKGIEGSDELRPGGVYVAELINGSYERKPVDSEALDLPIHISELSAPTDSLESRVEVSAARIRELLTSPRQESAFRNAVLLNAGLRLYAGGKSADIASGIALAVETLHSGAASNVLQSWQKRQ